MANDSVSITAIMTAFIRAYHAENDDPVVFHDVLSHRLIPEERRGLIEQGLNGSGAQLRTLLQTMGLPNVVSRARYTEDVLLAKMKTGVGQYVILGAGLDTFAFRHRELLTAGEIQVFEVDQPDTQTFKRQRLRDLGWEIPSGLYFVPADFRTQTLEEAFFETTYNHDVKTLFSLLGVTMYLSQQDAFNTLHSIAKIAPAGSSVIFDYHTEPDGQLQDIRQELDKLGESMATTFQPQQLRKELHNLGLEICEDIGSETIQDRYFQTSKSYHANENVRLTHWVVR